ncbi:MAG: hypothetical protein RRB51_11375 [Thermoproteus sp.]|jgi:hypothetical protein|nr:hypothetical protein [Thermoproteus sp.]
MLLKRAKIRAEIKAPEAAKEDQPFQVASKTPSASCKADCAPATTAPHSIIMAVVLI